MRRFRSSNWKYAFAGNMIGVIGLGVGFGFILLATIALLGGCSSTRTTSGGSVNSDLAMDEPYDGGVYTRCDHGNRIYYGDRGAAVVAQDPSCK